MYNCVNIKSFIVSCICISGDFGTRSGDCPDVSRGIVVGFYDWELHLGNVLPQHQPKPAEETPGTEPVAGLYPPPTWLKCS